MISYNDKYGMKPKFKLCCRTTKEHPGIPSCVCFLVLNGIKDDEYTMLKLRCEHFIFHISDIQDKQDSNPMIRKYLRKSYSLIDLKNSATYFNRVKGELDENFRLKLFIYAGCLCDKKYSELLYKIDEGKFDTSTISKVNSSFLRGLGLEFKGKEELGDLLDYDEFNFLKKYI
ncbi:MAG: hypothetical protein WC872_02770 [Candidatus Absconditabacterales bacterium]